MANGGSDGRLECLRGVDAGQVPVVEADPVDGLELFHELHDLGLVLEAVDDEGLEEDRFGLVGLVPVVVAADPDAVFVVKPDPERLVEASHREARDDQRHADERHDAGDDGHEVVLEQDLPPEEEGGVLVAGIDEVRTPNLDEAGLGRRARDALGVAHDVEVGVDEGPELAHKVALAVPPGEMSLPLQHCFLVVTDV